MLANSLKTRLAVASTPLISPLEPSIDEVKEDIKEEVKEDVKEEVKEDVKEEVKEDVKEEKVVVAIPKVETQASTSVGIKRRTNPEEDVKHLSDLLTHAVTQQFNVLRRLRKFMDQVRITAWSSFPSLLYRIILFHYHH